MAIVLAIAHPHLIPVFCRPGFCFIKPGIVMVMRRFTLSQDAQPCVGWSVVLQILARTVRWLRFAACIQSPIKARARSGIQMTPGKAVVYINKSIRG
jgi:hypothetical protein